MFVLGVAYCSFMMPGEGESDEISEEMQCKIFFDGIENELDMTISPYMRCILVACAFNDCLTLSKIDHSSIEMMKTFIDWEYGREVLTDKLSSITLSPLEKNEKPSNFLLIPGNRLRLDGIVQHCKLKVENRRKDSAKASKAGGQTSLKARSASHATAKPGPYDPPASLDESTEVAAILKTVLRAVNKVNVVPESKEALEVPQIHVLAVGKTLQARLTCEACPSSSKDKTATAYKKGPTTWIIANYSRHIERYHLQSLKVDKSIASFFSQPPSGGHGGSSGSGSNPGSGSSSGP